MSWSGAFLDIIESTAPIAPKWHLEFFEDFHGTIGTDYQISNWNPNFATVIGAVVSTGAGRITPGSWNFTQGGFTVEVVGDISEILNLVQRGNLARLLMGFGDWDLSDYQPVAIGALQSISGIYPNYVFQFKDLITHLQTRHTATTNELALFAAIDGATTGVRVSTTIRALTSYTVGDTVLNLTDKTGFDHGDKGAVIIDNGVDDPFFLTFTGTATSPDRLTGVGTSNVHDTVRVASPTGSTVTLAAWVGEHPCDFSRQILSSTGAGSNGAYDNLPKTWGLAVWDEWIDHDDINQIKSVIGNKAGTDHNWSVIVEESQDNAIGWLAAVLAPAGIWLCMRQGQITMRAAQNPNELSANRYNLPIISEIEITDRDIEEIEGWQGWHPDTPAEGFQSVVYYKYGHTTAGDSSVNLSDSTLVSLPAIEEMPHDLSDVIWQASNQPATDILYRCHMWELRIPEWIRLRCRGLRLAQLAVGDLVTLTTDRAQGRMDHTIAGYAECVAMVSAIEIFWADGIVTIELTIPSLEFGT